MQKQEKQIKKFQVIDILTLNDTEKAERLWFLFNEKYLDVFLHDCERLENAKIDLAQINKNKIHPCDFKVEYHSMKRVFDLANQNVELAKSSNEGWKIIKIDDLCTISVKTNGTILYLKANGEVDLNAKHIFYAAYLIKHYNVTIPFCKEAKDILEPSRVEKIGFIRLSIPVPFIRDRSTLVRGVGFRHSKKPSNIYVFAQGLNMQKQYLERFKIKLQSYMQGRELLDLKHCAIQVRYKGPKLIEFSAAATVDHHISFAPQKLVMFVAKQLGKHILNNLFDKLRKFDQTIWAKEYKQNYNQNRQFYEWINGVVDGLQISVAESKK